MGTDFEHMKLFLPDYAEQDTVWRHQKPFALWPVGEQPLLHHWLDEAVNVGASKVSFWTADRPHLIRQVMQKATLWPLQWEVHSVSDHQAPEGSMVADYLPGQPRPDIEITDGWSLLRYRQELERQWFSFFQDETRRYGDSITVGRYTNIHPSVTLHPPFWIGDEVMIGPGAEIGPYVVIGSGSMIAGRSIIRHAHISDHTYLGPEMELVDGLLDGPVLMNLRLQGRTELVDQFLASSMNEDHTAKPGLREKLLARWVYARCPKAHDAGATWPSEALGDLPMREGATVLQQRREWLPKVWRGQMRLFGVLPRSQAQRETLPAEWAAQLAHAPLGVISLADVHGVHDPEDPGEALHAAYQASQPESTWRPCLLKYVTEQLHQARS